MTQSLAITIDILGRYRITTDGLCTPLLGIPLTVFISVALRDCLMTTYRTNAVAFVMHDHLLSKQARPYTD